ncbi:MAG: glycosyltransferase [Clostridium sp.]|nr:glycosyltransferase [Clostridium sp.]
MKRVALISLHTPTVTNHAGASALPYHLIAFKPKNIEIEIWSYNLNQCNKDLIGESEKKLGVKIHPIAKPKWFSLLSPAPVRMLLSKPMLNYLTLPKTTTDEVYRFWGNGEDVGLWIYGEDIARFANRFKCKSTVITTPDCEAMYYHRVLAMKDIPLYTSTITRYSLMLHRYAKMEASFPIDNGVKYHLVGKEDTLFLRRLNPKIDAHFIKHPHYDFTPREINGVYGNEKIRVLMAGRYDFSMSQAVDEAMDAILTLPSSIKERYFITFLGKGWETCFQMLRQAGISSEHKIFVEDYVDELSSHHIQLTPIAVGTGTKGKVLDAFANGLMVIGTPLALENIDVAKGKECVEYTTPEELACWLRKIAIQPEIVKEMALAGAKAVLTKHSREKIAKEFFDLFS